LMILHLLLSIEMRSQSRLVLVMLLSCGRDLIESWLVGGILVFQRSAERIVFEFH